MSTRDVLLKAVDIIEDMGWWQGNLIGPHGERCVAEAIAEADSMVAPDAYAALRQHLGIGPDDQFAIGHWNDAPERTQEEVIAALRGAAEAQG